MAAEKQFIRTISYFQGLSEDDLDQINHVLFERAFERGDIIVYEGDQAEALYFVSSGAIKIFKTSVEGKEQILSIARPGDSFNDVPVFDNGIIPATAQAMGPVVVYELDKNELISLIRENTNIAENTIKVLAGEIRNLVTLVEDLSFRNVIGRVAKILLNYATEGTGTGPRLTQQEMAAMAGSAREVVGRSLKTLEESGLIKLNRQKVSITDIDGLREMVEEPV